jgi:SAM-dependent methyltransferase
LKQEWYETFFDGIAVDLWNRVMPPAVTNDEVSFLERSLDLAPAARVLDMPCGSGRHSIELATRGYNITGVDLSAYSLDIARAQFPQLDWRLGDMRSPPVDAASYDGAFCLGNSFAGLDHAGSQLFFSSVARALKPGARFVLHAPLVAESILPTLVRQRWHRAGDIFMLSENRYVAEESRLDIDYTFIHGVTVDTRPASFYVWTVAELRRLLQAAGLESVQMFSSLAGEPYQLGSPQLFLIAQRITPSAAS